MENWSSESNSPHINATYGNETQSFTDKLHSLWLQLNKELHSKGYLAMTNFQPQSRLVKPVDAFCIKTPSPRAILQALDLTVTPIIVITINAPLQGLKMNVKSTGIYRQMILLTFERLSYNNLGSASSDWVRGLVLMVLSTKLLVLRTILTALTGRYM